MKSNVRTARFIGTVLCVVAVTLPCFSQAVTKAESTLPTLAVNLLEARGINVDEAATLTDVLRNELINTRKYVVMERDQMEQILKEQGFQQSGACSDQACLVEIGQLLGAQQLVAGSIGKVGRAYSINIRIISVQSGQIINNVSHSYTGPIESLLTSEMAVVAKKLAGLPVHNTARAGSLNNILLYGSIGAGVVVVGGVAAYFIMQNAKPETPTTEVIVTW